MSTVQEIQDLAALLHDRRPDWDLVPTLNHLVPHKHLPYDQLVPAAIAVADNPSNRTPAMLQWLQTQPNGSAESDLSPRASKEPQCYICGRSRARCDQIRVVDTRYGFDPHEFETRDQAETNKARHQIDARIRARADADQARQKSKWKPAPQPSERRIQEPQPEETPA